MAKEKKFFCSNCLLFLSELEAMETHDQSHDIVRVMPEPALDPPRSGEPPQWTVSNEVATPQASGVIWLQGQSAEPSAAPSLEECAKAICEALAKTKSNTHWMALIKPILLCHFAGAVGRPEWDDLSAILDAAGVPDKEPGVLLGEEVFLSLESRVKWLAERGASSARSGETQRRCSFFTPQFGQCVYDEGHKEGHLYAEPAEG